MKYYQGIFLDADGNPKPAAQVRVRIPNTLTDAALFAFDNTPISNPVVTDTLGRFAFRVRSGAYDFVDAGNNFILREVQIFDMLHLEEWLDATKVITLSPLTQLNVQAELVNIYNLLSAIVGPGIASPPIVEQPAGTIDGVNATFTLANLPTQLLLFENGVMQRLVGSTTNEGEYTLSGQDITMGVPPPVGAQLIAVYWR